MSLPERPAPGTKVHVEFDATVEDWSYDHGWQLAVGEDDDWGSIHIVNLNSDSVTVTGRPTDENWPPQVGDVWEDVNGVTYHALRNPGNVVRWFNPRNSSSYPIDIYTPTDWKLAYRPDAA